MLKVTGAIVKFKVLNLAHCVKVIFVYYDRHSINPTSFNELDLNLRPQRRESGH